VSTVTALGGWVIAAIAATLLLVARRILGMRTEAVARACHELRGPLTAARLGLTFGSRGGEVSAGRLRAIDAELGRAALALDDLAGARGGAPQLRRLERVDVRRLVADSVEAWRAVGEAAGVTLHGPAGGAGGAVWGDRLRLAQAVGNLVANAIEHGGATVEARVARRGRFVRVEVSDDGRGLPAPVAELTRRARHARGARGHGLTIASEIAEVHRGRLAAAPVEVGARLVLELPAAGDGRVLPGAGDGADVRAGIGGDARAGDGRDAPADITTRWPRRSGGRDRPVR
jgi:signal transduction histidine kinase